MVQKKIGLVAMSAKPYHRGHDSLVQLAAEQCDRVLLFVSLADRQRPGEFVVRGEDMHEIWTQLIEPNLPENVELQFVSSPVGATWSVLRRAEQANRTRTVHVIYGDPTDLADRFSDQQLQKYVPKLLDRSAVARAAVERSLTQGVSGTRVRAALRAGDFKAFASSMPSWLDVDRAWSILRQRAALEELRTVVRMTLIEQQLSRRPRTWAHPSRSART